MNLINIKILFKMKLRQIYKIVNFIFEIDLTQDTSKN